MRIKQGDQKRTFDCERRSHQLSTQYAIINLISKEKMYYRTYVLKWSLHLCFKRPIQIIHLHFVGTQKIFQKVENLAITSKQTHLNSMWY